MSNLDTLQAQTKALNAADFEAFLTWIVSTERQRREALPAVRAGQSQLVQDLRKAGALPDIATPDNPEAPADFPAWETTVGNPNIVYAPGDMVCFEGKVYKSTYLGNNTSMPGTYEAGDAWVDVTAEVLADLVVDPGDDEGDETEEWAEGTRYETGTRITYSGKTYQVINTVPEAVMPPDISPDYQAE